MGCTVETRHFCDNYHRIRELGGKTEPIYQSDLAKVSVVGVGMRTHTGVAQRMI